MENTKRALLPGWKWVQLGDVCKQDRKIVEPRSALAKSLPYLSLEHIEANTGRILKEQSTGIEDEGVSTTFEFDCSHVLYGKLRPYLNKVAIPDFHGRCTTEIIPLLPTDGTNKEFLCWILRRPKTVIAAMEQKTGSRMPRADMDRLMSIEIPLPPLAEQKRIAAILNEQMGAVERAMKAAEEQIEAIRSLRPTYLHQTFPSSGHPLPEGWRWVSLGEVSLIISGQHILESDYNRNGRGIGYLTGPADFGPNMPTITKWTEWPKVCCEPSDVLVTVKGAGVGKVNLSPIEPVAIGRQLMAIRADKVVLDMFFLYYFIMTCFNHLKTSALGATVPGLDRNNLETLSIPLPPLTEQKQIAAMITEKLAAVEKAQNSAEGQLAIISALPITILNKAFSGEL